MISEVREVVDLVSHHLGELGNKFPIVRKEQSAKKPQYPFGAYKLLSVSGERWNSKRQIVNPDPSKITERYSKVRSSVVSLAFYISENTTSTPLSNQLTVPPIDVIYNLANRAVDFLQVLGLDKFSTLGVVVELINANITDRTVYLDPIYEYSVGFDFKIKAKSSFDRVTTAVDLDATIEGVEFVVE